MTKNIERPSLLRISAAVILGCIVGSIMFLIVALGIGAINDRMGMNIPINMLIAENIWSAAVLLIFIIIAVYVFCRQVWNTPPTAPYE
jgi:Na+/H+ antiporter NhaC